jgi:hypothetical protein
VDDDVSFIEKVSNPLDHLLLAVVIFGTPHDLVFVVPLGTNTDDSVGLDYLDVGDVLLVLPEDQDMRGRSFNVKRQYFGTIQWNPSL